MSLQWGDVDRSRKTVLLFSILEPTAYLKKAFVMSLLLKFVLPSSVQIEHLLLERHGRRLVPSTARLHVS